MLPFSLGNRCVHPGVQAQASRKRFKIMKAHLIWSMGCRIVPKDRKQDKVQLGHGFCNCFFQQNIVEPSTIYLSLSTYLPICLSIYLSTYLSICLSIYPSIYLSAVPLQAAEGHKMFAVLYFFKIKCGLTLCVVFQKLQHVPCIVALYAALKCSIFKPYCTLCGSLSLSQRF